ncbi:MAG TPA: alpha-amylase/4-alpha-glucanotransferase domain-containing protein [Rhodocyclaceae bacterium]|nr:alpha-amylase/4-alpha-glucanotransferase domain-containing protein [Rhodocyclaceae bacterium]
MTISLLLGVHAHQPVGNFTEVIDDAHLRCYGMFIRVLHRYPEFRFSVHFSGWLLDLLYERHPADMQLLAEMTERGQVEWFGSGDCEPVLAAIPHRDRLTQIETLSAKIARYTGTRPRGAWLTERVWESAVAASLAEAGIEYVAVDDYHFLCTGAAANTLDSFYTTEESGRTLDLFPISEQARYRLPFAPAAETVAWMEELARQGQRAVIYFDDIEKFGIWPETYNWVYERGWLAQFIEGVLASPLIRTQTYAEYYAANATRGIVYLPTTSYIEMNEWSLPGPAARTYHALVEAEKQRGQFEAHKPFLRGGIWRNFFSRYPESNWMHKRTLEASERYAALAPALQTAELQELLHRAQANDAFWHGLFGGLYLPHLRRAIWNNLLALEARLNAIAPRAAVSSVDCDLDGHTEVFIADRAMLAAIRPDGDAAVIELSSYALAHNFGDTLRRYEEGYHARVATSEASAHAAEAPAGGIASAHDRISFKHVIVAADIVPDMRPRSLFVDTWIGDDDTALVPDYVAGGPLSYSADDGVLRLRKSYALDGGSLKASYLASENGVLQIELNLAMPSCDGYAGRYVLADGSIPCGFGQALDIERATRLSLVDGVLGGKLILASNQPVDISGRPHFTVSQSEAGFEKIMQAAVLTLRWQAVPEQTLEITLTAETGE